jgi:hypothetical protein
LRRRYAAKKISVVCRSLRLCGEKSLMEVPMPRDSDYPHALPPGERLARLEAQIDQLLLTTARAHADLRECVEWQRRIYETQDARITSLQTAHEETRTHLKWIKAIWLAVQSTVIGWVGMKN